LVLVPMARQVLLVAACAALAFPVSASADPGALDILIVHADDAAPTPLATQIAARPGVDTVDSHDERAQGTPSLATLQAYDLVVTFSNYPWANTTALGNNLADYVDAGGAVVDLNYSNYAPIAPGGRWNSDSYSPFNEGFGALHVGDTLGTYDSSHALMQNVSGLVSDRRVSGLTLRPGATQVAAWSDGSPLVAFKNRVVAINAYLSAGQSGYGTWSGDFATVIVNAGNFGATPANADPTVSSAAADANGTEGDTLSTSGSFSDTDAGDTLTLSADNTEGTFTDNGDGTWDWELATTDDVTGGTITVTADDGNGGTATDAFDYSAANANPVLSALSLSAGGTSSCNPTLGFSFTDVGSGDTHSGSIDWGDSSTDDLFTASPVSRGHAYSSAGTYTIGVNVADDDAGTDSDSVQRTVYNVPSNLLDPMNADGSSRFKRGSTIPLKLRVLDCAGRPVTGLVIQVALKQINESGGNIQTVNEIVSNVAGDAGNRMRESSGYIFNLSSKRSQFNAGQDLVVGKYRLTLTSPTFPGSAHAVTQDFRLVK
jgi:hypothetical protein